MIKVILILFAFLIISTLYENFASKDICEYKKGKYCTKSGKCNETCTTIGRHSCPFGHD